MSAPPPNWSSDELKALLNQALALEFVKLKGKPPEETRPASTWLSILQSNVVATLITVLVGTVLGGILAARIQETNRRNDDLRAREQANLADEQKTVADAFTVVGQTVAASQDLIDITGEGFNDAAPELSPDERKEIAAQKRVIWEKYNSAIAEWRVQKDRLGMLLALRHKNPEEIKSAWKAVSDSVDQFSDCSLVYNKQNLKPVPHAELQGGCDPSRTTLRKGLGDLTQLIVRAQMSAEDPAKPAAAGK